jgi:isoleucyl-tRNA synthetase
MSSFHSYQVIGGWLARREYFYIIEKLGDRPLEAAQNVEYFFEPPKNRFVEIIREQHPWCISRERVWGTPLPIWSCIKCGHKEPLFSRSEIVKKATELPDGPDFELHRPWIDTRPDSKGSINVLDGIRKRGIYQAH